jgi:hypothetical protein
VFFPDKPAVGHFIDPHADHGAGLPGIHYTNVD